MLAWGTPTPTSVDNEDADYQDFMSRKTIMFIGSPNFNGHTNITLYNSNTTDYHAQTRHYDEWFNH